MSEFILGAPVIKNEWKWIIFLWLCEKESFPGAQQNTTHFTLNLKLPHMQSYFLKAIYGKQRKQSMLCQDYLFEE